MIAATFEKSSRILSYFFNRMSRLKKVNVKQIDKKYWFAVIAAWLI